MNPLRLIEHLAFAGWAKLPRYSATGRIATLGRGETRPSRSSAAPARSLPRSAVGARIRRPSSGTSWPPKVFVLAAFALIGGCSPQSPAGNTTAATAEEQARLLKAILGIVEKIEEASGQPETTQTRNGTPTPAIQDSAGLLLAAKRLTGVAVERRTPEALSDALSAAGECDENDKELAGIQSQLDQLQSELEIKSAVDALDKKLGKAAAVSELRARSLCLMQVAAESNQLYAEALLSEPAQHPSILKSCAALSEKASSALRDAEESKSRAYQEWALKKRDLYEQRSFVKAKEEIRVRLESFKHPPAAGPVDWPLLDEFARFREFLSEKTGARIDGSSLTSEQQARIYASVSSWLPNIVKNPENLDAFAYRVTREAFIKYLLPIDERLLDRPVQILYTKSYEAGWKTLDDVPEDQRFVAEQGVQIRKRTPDEVLD